MAVRPLLNVYRPRPGDLRIFVDDQGAADESSQRVPPRRGLTEGPDWKVLDAEDWTLIV